MLISDRRTTRLRANLSETTVLRWENGGVIYEMVDVYYEGDGAVSISR